MDRKLYLRIEEAEQDRDDSICLRDAIIRLTDNEPAVSCLLNEYRNALFNAEKLWREIEQMPEFRQRYKSRDDCRVDFLRQYYSKD